ncbi:MAG: hypothetical protein K0A98_00695 [Trueperaceae bacterium]|nr:hypothetical protein [Trueperaceae bacterium]
MTWFRTPALAVVALVASWAGAWSLAGTPYGAIVDDLLLRFHAQERACRVAQAPAEACFVVDPGRAALLAEAVEAFLAEHAGAVVRGPWSSANGTHRVALSLPDAGWGVLELWLVEVAGHRIEGRFRHLPERGR